MRSSGAAIQITSRSMSTCVQNKSTEPELSDASNAMCSHAAMFAHILLQQIKNKLLCLNLRTSQGFLFHTSPQRKCGNPMLMIL